jgi:hypothetical protein
MRLASHKIISFGSKISEGDMNDVKSNTDPEISRRTLVELLAGCGSVVTAALLIPGSAAAFNTICRYAFDAATPTTAAIKNLFNLLDDRPWEVQALAVSLLGLVEDDYFGHVWRERPTDLWECVETWPPEARQEAVKLLLPMMSEQMSTSG